MTESPRSLDAGDLDLATDLVRVHDLLAEWLGSAASPRVLDAFAAAHDDDFSMVTTAGTVVAKHELLTGLHRARNTRPGLAIEISDVETICRADDIAVVRFVECQRAADEPEYRRTIAVARVDPRNGVRWLSLQETAVTTPADLIGSEK